MSPKQIPNDITLKKYCNDKSIIITLANNDCPYLIGEASCSKITDNMWYFNRLFVQPAYRGNNYGSILLDELLSIINKTNTILQLDINPYGEMSYNDLEEFYIRHGFVKVIEKCGLFNEKFPRYYYNAFIRNKR